MKKRDIYIAIIFICLISGWFIVKKSDLTKEGVLPANITENGYQDNNYTISRHIQYSFTLRNKTNQLIKNARFWTYAPVKQNSIQKCVNIETSQPYKLITDKLGNQILYFTFDKLPPYAAKIITVKAELLLSNAVNQNLAKTIDTQLYLQPEEYCQSDAPEIIQLAAQLNAKSLDNINKTEKTVKSIFKWITANLKYTGYTRNPRGALYALKNKQGDCTEYMYLFTALCRASQIPARGIGGYVITQNSVLKPSGYHNWVEFYNQDTWRLADLQRKTLMTKESNYIAMQILSPLSETDSNGAGNPIGNHHRFCFSGEGLEVKMDG